MLHTHKCYHVMSLNFKKIEERDEYETNVSAITFFKFSFTILDLNNDVSPLIDERDEYET